jgi:hypothetical protein
VKHFIYQNAAPLLTLLGASFSLQSLGFNPTQLHVTFVVDEMALEQIFLSFFGASPANHHSIAAPYSSSTIPYGVRQS